MSTSTVNEILEQCIDNLIIERYVISKHLQRLQEYEETLINDTRHFKRLLKKRIDASAVDSLTMRLIISTRQDKRNALWKKV